MIRAIPPWAVRQVAEQHKDQIDRACSRSVGLSPDELIGEAERREATMWLVSDEGVCFTRIALPQNRRAVEVVTYGGLGALRWAPALRDRLHQYRKAEKAEFLLVVGRKGWGRMFHIAPVGMNTAGQYIFEDYG